KSSTTRGVRVPAQNLAAIRPPRGSRGGAMDDRPADAVPPLTSAEVERIIIANLPAVDHHGEVVESVGVDSIRVRLPFKSHYVGGEAWQDGSGQGVHGPVVMGFGTT